MWLHSWVYLHQIIIDPWVSDIKSLSIRLSSVPNIDVCSVDGAVYAIKRSNKPISGLADEFANYKNEKLWTITLTASFSICSLSRTKTTKKIPFFNVDVVCIFTNRYNLRYTSFETCLFEIWVFLCRKRLLREVVAHAAISVQPHIVRYFSAWEEDDHMLIQNEFCDGLLRYGLFLTAITDYY